MSDEIEQKIIALYGLGMSYNDIAAHLKEIYGLDISNATLSTVTESEGANFWLQVLTDLSDKGVQDILIACVDELKGFPEAIE